jgi:hypothetical protein
MKEQFFHRLEFTPVNAVTVSHFVTAIHIVHMMVTNHHNLQLYGFSSLIAAVTFHWDIVDICQHAYV